MLANKIQKILLSIQPKLGCEESRIESIILICGDIKRHLIVVAGRGVKNLPNE